MSGDEVAVERAALRRQAKRFGDGATKVNAIFKALESALAAEGQPWGNDATGKSFESHYKQPHQTMESSFEALPKKLQQAQDAVESMADNYDNAETSSGGLSL